MAVYAGEPGTAECVSSVSLFLLFTICVWVSQSGAYGVVFFCSLTQATDTTNIRLVFAAVKETILQNALKDSGIL